MRLCAAIRIKVMFEDVEVNSFLASRDFFRLLIAYASSLDPYQNKHSVSLDLGPDCLTP